MQVVLKFLFVLLCLLLLSCNNEVQPKPAAQMALQYPKGDAITINKSNCPYTFDVNEYARVLSKDDCSIKIEYPYMEATIYLDYKEVNNNLTDLLIDGQKLTYKHNKMADVIAEFPYQNKNNRVYGMMYEVEGNAASNAQFYVTDSTKHFITAALYFYSKPNYDSIYPAVDYVKKDMTKLIESLRWKN